MASSLLDKSRAPDDTSLSAELGATLAYWNALLAYVESVCPEVTRAWKFYGKHGWQLKLAWKKQSVLYLIPKQGCFAAAFALNDAAVAALRASRLPVSLLQEIEDAKTYPEGKPARVEVTGREQVEFVEVLCAAKLDTVVPARRSRAAAPRPPTGRG